MGKLGKQGFPAPSTTPTAFPSECERCIVASSHTSKDMTGLGAGICPLLYIYIARELLI